MCGEGRKFDPCIVQISFFVFLDGDFLCVFCFCFCLIVDEGERGVGRGSEVFFGWGKRWSS